MTELNGTTLAQWVSASLSDMNVTDLTENEEWQLAVRLSAKLKEFRMDNPAPRPLAVGDIIHGFAEGAWGRDYYACVRIEQRGVDWVVARPFLGRPVYTSGKENLESLIKARDEECPGGADACEWADM